MRLHDGSKTAKRGFAKEKEVASKFNNWKNDDIAKEWLIIMGYKLDEIEKVEATILHGHKTDVQVGVIIYHKEGVDYRNISVKLVSSKVNLNQIDKRWVDKYKELWNIPDDIVHILKLYTGEIKHNRKDLRKSERMFLDEFPIRDQEKVVKFFTDNKVLIINDVLRGRAPHPAEWMLVAHISESGERWVLKHMHNVISHYFIGDVHINRNGNLYIGSIRMQRKGGDKGKNSANMLQFKANPLELFNI